MPMPAAGIQATFAFKQTARNMEPLYDRWVLWTGNEVGGVAARQGLVWEC